jgi:hypothetical protein
VEFSDIAPVVVALIGLVGLVVTRPRRSHLRDEVEQDQRIVAKLPAKSENRAALQSSIDARVEQIARSGEGSRDSNGIGAGVALLVVALASGWGALQGGWWGWLWVLAVACGAMGLFGLIESVPKAPRDAQGNRTGVKD